MVRRSLWGLLSLLAAACGSDPGAQVDLGGSPSDAGPRDLGFLPNDGGVPDVGPGDSGAFDTGASDTGPIDRGTTEDVGPSDIGTDGGTFTARFTEHLIDDQFRHGQGGQLIDIDGDGDLDAVIASSLSDTVFLYVNENQAQSWTRVALAPVDTLVAMDTAVADFDGDGDLDVAAVGLFTRADGFGSPGEVTWFENNGDPRQGWTLHPITGLTVPWPFRVEAADFTGDGRPDLIVTQGDPNGGAAGNGVRLYPWTSPGFGAAQVVDDTILDVTAVQVVDVDGDGAPDVIAGGNANNEVAWFENETPPGQVDSTPAFTRHVIGTPPAPKFLGTANLDADAALELVVTISRGAGEIVAYDPPADPRQPWTESTISAEFGGGSTRFALADFDRDGTTDVAAASMPAGGVRLFRRVAGSWQQDPIGDKFGVIWALSGDFNGDGRPDVLTTTYERSGTEDHVTWWENQP